MSLICYPKSFLALNVLFRILSKAMIKNALKAGLDLVEKCTHAQESIDEDMEGISVGGGIHGLMVNS